MEEWPVQAFLPTGVSGNPDRWHYPSLNVESLAPGSVHAQAISRRPQADNFHGLASDAQRDPHGRLQRKRPLHV